MAQSNSAASGAAVPAVQQKAYDGMQVVTHVVQEGQTLSRIGEVYRFPRWEPIWLYNTKVEQTLGGDPDEVDKGVQIFIPRSDKGYEKLLKKLEVLKVQVEGDSDRIAGELDSMGWELKADKEILNFAGDALTLVGTLWLKLGSTAKLAAAAEKSVGQAKIAARIAARAEGRQLAEKFVAARGRLLKTALEDGKKLREGRELVREFYKDKVIDTAVKLADSRYQKSGGGDEATPFKHVKNLGKIGKGLRSHGLSVGALGDVADVLLDYIEPAGVAELYLRLTTGASAEETIDGQKENLEKATEANIERLQEKIDRYEEERELLYG